MIKITQKKVNELNPSSYNPRDISDNAFEGLKESIKKFGLVDPLILNTRTGNLVGGHQRLKAAISLGFETVPVVEVDLSSAEEKALNVTLNNPNISGHYNEGLKVLLEEIKLELPELNFEELRLDNLEHLIVGGEWESDLSSLNKTNDHESNNKAKIIIECPQDLKDEVLIYIKAKFMETSFEGVHVK